MLPPSLRDVDGEPHHDGDGAQEEDRCGEEEGNQDEQRLHGGKATSGDSTFDLNEFELELHGSGGDGSGTVGANGGHPDRGGEDDEGGPPRQDPQGSDQARRGDAEPGQELSLQASRVLDRRSQRLIPDLFEGLIGDRRVELLEVTAEQDSLLAKTIVARTGRSDSACRSALWDGHDLSRAEGLAVILEQIRTLKPRQPRHVWISPPTKAFSPLQNLNQRTPAQVRDLKAKRALEIQTFENTVELVKTCMQVGSHVTVELAEKSEAWRLPVLQELRYHMGLHTCVSNGCAVGLRGQNNKLLQKGWRLVTTHQRLANKLHKPCRCPTNYEHAKSERGGCQGMKGYTSEFVRLVCEALSMEGEGSEVVQECSGVSQLPEGFGLGSRCTCEGLRDSRVCGSCVLGEPEEDMDQAQAYMSSSHRQELEQEAKELSQQTLEANLKPLQKLLTRHPLQNLGTSRRSRKKPNTYHAFGAYSYGNQYGATSRTHSLPELCKYVNRLLKQYLPEHLRWTSFVVNHGNCMPIHRDSHNDGEFPNGSVGFGGYSGGGLWVQGEASDFVRSGVASERKGPHGETLKGFEFDLQEQGLVFPPKSWHGTCPWEGDTWVITVFVSRGWRQLDAGVRDTLLRLGFPMPKLERGEAYPAERVTPGPIGNQRDERIKKQLYLLHSATGHSHPRHMIQALKKRGADARTLELAESFQCPVCQEKSRPPPRVLASLEPLPPKLSTICADVGHFTHPKTEECVQFMLVIDEGSRYRVARILTRGSKQAPKAADCIHYLQEGWVQYFGHPRCLRLGPAGAFRSASIEDWCDRHQIFLDIVPGEAHWKIGACENAIKGVKEVMQKLCLQDEDISAEEALAEAVLVFNQKDLIRGFSPAQHLLGQAPDNTGRFIPGCSEIPPGLMVEDPMGSLRDQ